MKEYIEALEQSYAQAQNKTSSEQIAALVFDKFFQAFPEVKETYFASTDLDSYFGSFKLNTIYAFFIDMVKHPDYTEPQLLQEIMRHEVYGLKDKEYFFAIIDCFVMAIKETLGEDWNEGFETAWNDVSLAFRPIISEAVETYFG